ncbi:hypothetical protein MmiEs2_05220 [Methanimicrococcus stummii]|uniref:GIY-YIG domain-containing protein n=1 Tax=Methanimicrococcus stummii TaxID=3028294 RepID=A0AA96VL82_9EURY|nr:GIY-YIG nuclease family protein [Methanimicrococcus sp. Es2]WNY28337.1 hypothetical protein MmiEs2_05220 [Methanimicrococcus sp. Es2]
MKKVQNCKKYELRDGNKVVYRGITNDLNRRKQEHQQDKKFTSMAQVGRACSEESARKWEQKSLETYRKNHSGKNPKYNQKKNG